MKASCSRKTQDISAGTATMIRTRAPRLRGLAAIVALGLFSLPVACDKPRPSIELPSGTWVYGDAASITELLETFETLQGTPLARNAMALRTRLASCGDFIARTEGTNPTALIESITCAADVTVPEALRELRAGQAAAFSVELTAGKWIRGQLVRDSAGSVNLVATLDAGSIAGLATLAVPGNEPAGEAALNDENALIRARLRPAAGLNVASMVSQDSQADQMFRLRSELFLGQVLDGTWELAVYMPQPGQMTPPMALALDYSIKAAATAAMEKFVAELETTWPIHHSPFEHAGSKGACFYELRLLPDLAPCYVVTDRSVVVGWNAASLALALAPKAPGDVAARSLSVDRGGLLLNLDQLPEADRRLQHQLGMADDSKALDYVWDALRVEAEPSGDNLELRVSLEKVGAS